MLKSTGIVRKVDELGRIVLPIELRRVYEMEEKDEIEIYVNGDYILLKKYSPQCVFCGNTLLGFKGKNICPECASEM